MPRADLLALTADDLASLTNRGTVKRAQKELENAEVSCEINETETELTFQWSDGIQCRFPANKSIHDATCSSGSMGISRHIVRSVLAYQQAASRVIESSTSESVVASTEGVTSIEFDPSAGIDSGNNQASTSLMGVWDPGSITDEMLAVAYRKSDLQRAHKRLEQGILVELTRGSKPTARFLDESCTVRFLVPMDLRYAQADVSEALWSTWIPLAVWAFRQLPADQLAGLVSFHLSTPTAPLQLLDDLEALLSELCLNGLSRLGPTWSARVSRIEEALRSEGLVWPAELAADLLQQTEMYAQHDARFEPRRVLELVGELICRCRAIRQPNHCVPHALIRGSRSDRPSEYSGGRLVGVGLGARIGKNNVAIQAYMQDADSGSVMAIERVLGKSEQPGESSKSLTDLAEFVIQRGVSLNNLAASQLLIKSGKRTPSGLLILPRTSNALSANPQTYQWESLKPPLAVERLAQLIARFDSLPPSYLRPRRCTENLHVIFVSQVADVVFDSTHQTLRATLVDSAGDTIQLVHPFHSLAEQGLNALQQSLTQYPDQLKFVSGHVRRSGRLLEINPICVVFDDGKERRAILPWVSRVSTATNSEAFTLLGDQSTGPSVDRFLGELFDSLADLLVTGTSGADQRRWSELLDTGQRLGFVRMTQLFGKLAELLEARANQLQWDSSPSIKVAKELFVIARVAMD